MSHITFISSCTRSHCSRSSFFPLHSWTTQPSWYPQQTLGLLTDTVKTPGSLVLAWWYFQHHWEYCHFYQKGSDKIYTRLAGFGDLVILGNLEILGNLGILVLWHYQAFTYTLETGIAFQALEREYPLKKLSTGTLESVFMTWIFSGYCNNKYPMTSWYLVIRTNTKSSTKVIVSMERHRAFHNHGW